VTHDALHVSSPAKRFGGRSRAAAVLRDIGAARVIVPRAVFDEVARAGRTDLAARSLAHADWIEQGAPVSIPTSISEWDLGPGESAVIATALQISGSPYGKRQS
jgi:hypothetical protein